VFRDGEIKNANFHREINATDIKKWFRAIETDNMMLEDFQAIEQAHMPFHERLQWVRELVPEEGRIFVLPHETLGADWSTQVETELEKIVSGGGEGMIFRDPNGLWEPKRLASTLKYKPFEDAEANIIGIVAGRAGRIGQALGKIGAIICEARIRPSRDYITFEVGSGLTMEQRELPPELSNWAKDHPGEEIPVYDVIQNNYNWDGKLNETLWMNSRFTFKYRELSDDGIPKEPRFWRMRNE